MAKETDKQIKLKFLMFENDKNICWLDASIALVAHNRTFKKIVEGSPKSEINKIISTYNEAIATLNNSDCLVEQRITETKEMLLNIQTSTLDYLKQFLKFKPGEPDSAFCALLNLIYQDKSNIKELLNVSWVWRKQCSNCGANLKSGTCMKPIITLSKVNTFRPECPSSIYMCSCKLEQEMKLIYKELSPCLIFHFENGAGSGTNFPTSFIIKNREYQLTSVVMLEKSSDPSLNHFVTWIRNPSFNMWLECNDLNTSIVSFSPIKPEFDLKDVYMYVFEAFDNLDKINNEVSTDPEHDVENVNVELIDLSDDSDDHKNADSCCESRTSEISKSIKDDGTPNSAQNSLCYSEKDASKKELLVNNKDERTSINVQNIKVCSNKEIGNPCKVNHENVSVSNPRFPNKTSVYKCETEAKYKNFDCKDNAVETKYKTKEIDYPGLKVTDASVANKKEIIVNPFVINKTSITMQNLKMRDCEDYKENINNHNVSVSNLISTNKFSPYKHETEVKSETFYSQDKVVDEPVENKESEAEITGYPQSKVIDASVRNKKETFSSPFSPDNVTEDASANDTTYYETFSEKNSAHSSAIFEDTSDERETEMNKYVENWQVKMKERSLRKNEEKYLGLIKENDDKYVSSNDDEEEEIMSEGTDTSSETDDEITKNTLQKCERTSESNSDYSQKKSKMLINKVNGFKKSNADMITQDSYANEKYQNATNKVHKKINWEKYTGIAFAKLNAAVIKIHMDKFKL